MEALEILDLISKGESSKVQFKERLPNQDSIAQEFVAFSNTEGGNIIIGVNDKTGNLNGLTFEEIQHANQLLVNIASQHVFPPIFITTEIITINGNNLIVVNIPEGESKPYKDRNSAIYKKNGSDKRKVTSNDEISRLLQSSKIVYADELPIQGSTIADVDIDKFKSFVKKRYDKTLEELDLELGRALENLNLMNNGSLTLVGLLLFSNNRQKYRPQFSIQCVAVNDTVITGNNYADNEPAFDGTIPEVFQSTLSFINRNIRKIQSGISFNSIALPEIPIEVFEELLVNALVHRDYFVSSTIKVFIYSDRIEIISPGNLPNSLSIDNILNGLSIPRNPILQSIAQYVMPYKGLGTGVRRAVAIYPDILFTNSLQEQRFIVSIKRPQIKE